MVKSFGFVKSEQDSCVYKKFSESSMVFLLLYVDDILLVGNNVTMLQETNDSLERCFQMKDLGEMAFILGIKIYRDRSRRLIGLSQSAYLDKILKKFNMESVKRGSCRCSMVSGLARLKAQCQLMSEAGWR